MPLSGDGRDPGRAGGDGSDHRLDARRIRAALATVDGRRYAGPDDDMKVIWDAGVAEAREAIEVGWVA
ncbi:MAG: hypothetical protein WB800_19205 [Streptosporangiaceae bacterium]